MYLGRYEHELRVVLIKARHGQLSRDEASAQMKSILSRLQKDAAKAKSRVDEVVSYYLSDKCITVYEGEEGIWLG